MINRKTFYFFIITLTLAIFISGTLFADTTYVIKKGDTPAKIAKKFKVKTEDIIKINHLNPRRLKPGTKITVPSNEKNTSHKSDSAKKHKNKSTRNSETALKHNADPLFHIVKKGDTLSSLSRRYSISIDELKDLNNLRSTRLKIGQKLAVNKVQTKTYTVRNGDNIYKIARKFQIDIGMLRDNNALESDLIKPGQKLIIQPEREPEELKQYETILSRPQVEEETESVSETEESSLTDKLVFFAQKLLDIPYKFGGNSLFGIDCSAYVQKVYSLIGINLPRSAREQFTEGDPVDKEELSIGDLVFFRTYASFPSHVGIYLGNDLFIHASSKKKKVTIDSLDTPYYLKRFIGAKRVLLESRSEKDPQNDG